MNISGSLLGRLGKIGFILASLAALWGLIVHYGIRLGLETRSMQMLALAVLCLGLTLIRYLPAIIKYGQEMAHRRQARQDNALPEDESRLLQSPPGHIIVDSIHTALRHQYGRLWGRKIRILIITGNDDDVEQLTPGLTSQYWQEDQGTLLLWGGDPLLAEDSAWFTALRTLRHRPADGLVWVTAALDDSALTPPSEDMLDRIAHGINARYACLRWRLPFYVWSLHKTGSTNERALQPVGCLLPFGCNAARLTEQLQALATRLVPQGIQQICGAHQHHFLLSLAAQIAHNLNGITGPLTTLLNPYRPLPLAGIVFSPATDGGKRTVKHHWGMDSRWHVLTDSVHTLPAGLRPSKPGFSWGKAMAIIAGMFLVLGGVATVVSYLGNRSLIVKALEQVHHAQDARQTLSGRLRELAELQKILTRLEYRESHGAPWHLRAGLNQNSDLLSAVLPRYAEIALPLLRDSAGAHLHQQLTAFVQLPANSTERSRMAKVAYDQLKLYLMLSLPQRMEPAWFSRTLMQHWPQREGVSHGIWQTNGRELLAFYGTQFVTHPHWQLTPDEGLVSQSRTVLIRLMGVRNSDATLYQKMLAQVAHQYADMRLEDMTGDTDASRLFTTREVVPGMFTRQAWEEAVKPAIEQVASGQREEPDWALTEDALLSGQQAPPEALQQRLTQRYFTDFGGAWLSFLNSLRWQRTETLSDAIDQLTLMADIRQSPLVALMNTLSIQGRTGQTGEAVTASLVKSAKNLIAGDKKPVIDQSVVMHGPLDTVFGPLLALLDTQANGSTELNLQTYLTRTTQVRLRLQQVTNSPDPQAMLQSLAQTVFQGKAVDLTATRDYGSLMAAGLGQEWSGFGQTMFVRPMEQAWQQVLTPAAISLNAQWRSAVVDGWNNAFAGRYPFKNVSSEASLPLLAKYINSEYGSITRFLQTSLNGVLHREGDRWIPDRINAQGLKFNPAFLKAINTLHQLANVAFINGEAKLNFELRPGTAAGVMQTDLSIDSQKLTYVNQMPDWKRFTWPADTESPGAILSWISTQAGTRQYTDQPGNWGFIRLLEMADREPYPGTGSSHTLRWKAQDGRMLNYTLRTEAGDGPLALLELRNFVLPDTIFRVNNAADTGSTTSAPADAGDLAEGIY